MKKSSLLRYLYCALVLSFAHNAFAGDHAKPRRGFYFSNWTKAVSTRKFIREASLTPEVRKHLVALAPYRTEGDKTHYPTVSEGLSTYQFFGVDDEPLDLVSYEIEKTASENHLLLNYWDKPRFKLPDSSLVLIPAVWHNGKQKKSGYMVVDIKKCEKDIMLSLHMERKAYSRLYNTIRILEVTSAPFWKLWMQMEEHLRNEVYPKTRALVDRIVAQLSLPLKYKTNEMREYEKMIDKLMEENSVHFGITVETEHIAEILRAAEAKPHFQESGRMIEFMEKMKEAQVEFMSRKLDKFRFR